MNSRRRMCLVQDPGCNWYLIPVTKRDQWDQFLDASPDSDEWWDVPSWATALEHGPESIESFTGVRL